MDSPPSGSAQRSPDRFEKATRKILGLAEGHGTLAESLGVETRDSPKGIVCSRSLRAIPIIPSRKLIKSALKTIAMRAHAQLIARHSRSYDRHQDIEDPDHPKALLEQRRNAREQRLLMRFLSLSAKAQTYHEGLEQRRMNPRHHLRKIVALSEIYGVDEVGRAIEDGIAFDAYSCEYIANILEMRARSLPEPGALQLIRRQDLLDIEIAAPDLSPYEVDGDESD